MIDIIIWLAILVIVLVVVWYLLSQANLPEPVGKIITIVLVVFVAVIAIVMLLKLGGGSGHFTLPR